MCLIRQRTQSNVYVGDLQAHGTRLASLRQLTSDEANNTPYAWASGSRAILFCSDRDGQSHIYKQDLDKDTADRITSGPGEQFIPRISPDGQLLLYENDTTSGHPRVMRMPLAGGAAEEILKISADDSTTGFNCSRVAGEACVLNQRKGNGSILTTSLFDPVRGLGPKIVETKHWDSGDPAISPDGRHIAFALPGNPSSIRISDLHGATETEITISGAENICTLEWSADGAGFFSVDTRADGTRLLYVERKGSSHVLWTQPTKTIAYGIPSPDGRHLATLKYDITANVWMVENP